MKWLCYLFAVFFLCMDLAVCRDETTTIKTGTIAVFQAQDHHNSREACTPLCQCCCCNMQVDICKKISICPAESIHSPISDTFLPKETVTRPANIWLPPKLILS